MLVAMWYTKILTNRVKKFVYLVVSPSRYAFILGRYIQDSILLSHEILQGYYNNKELKRCTMMVDLWEVYDTMRWEVIEFALSKGFQKNSETGCRL